MTTVEERRRRAAAIPTLPLSASASWIMFMSAFLPFNDVSSDLFLPLKSGLEDHIGTVQESQKQINDLNVGIRNLLITLHTARRYPSFAARRLISYSYTSSILSN